MKSMHSVQSSKARAAEVLKTVLHQVSAIKLKNIEFESTDPEGKIDILARVDVYGHSHDLACKVVASEEISQDFQWLQEFREHAARISANATPVVIGTRLSPEARTLCHELQAGFLDLEGNARLEIGEVFIARQYLPARHEHTSHKSVVPGLEGTMHRKLSPVRAEILSPDRGVVVASA